MCFTKISRSRKRCYTRHSKTDTPIYNEQYYPMHSRARFFVKTSSHLAFILALQIKSIDKQHSVGVITKKWSGLAREFFKDGNSFGVGFPVDLDVKIKAVLLGACFLVVSIYNTSAPAFLCSFITYSMQTEC